MSPISMPRRKLPIGIQNLREIREQGHCYVDKTGLAIDLIESSGKAFFLSRPRRFGKSLLVDTFKELFEGNDGNDTLLGGSGNDSLSDFFGSAVLDGGEGDDTLQAANFASGMATAVLSGGAQAPTIWAFLLSVPHGLMAAATTTHSALSACAHRPCSAAAATS